MDDLADKWIEKLGLQPHPEGGNFREIYRSAQIFPGSQCVPARKTSRCSATSIYFLLKEKQVSTWHRLKSDEIWYFHQGSTVIIHTFSQGVGYQRFRLDNSPLPDHFPQVVIPAHTIFGAEMEDKKSYGLVGCVVSPGFEFEDFELIKSEELVENFPKYRAIINKLRPNAE